MTVKEALEKHHITTDQWELFLQIARGNVRPPEKEKHERKPKHVARVKEWVRDSPNWAYIGGMRDTLWAWLNKDREAFDALNEELTKAATGEVKAVCQEVLK